MNNNLDRPRIGFNFLHHLAQPLVIIGALNWGLVSAFKFDLVRALFGASSLTPLVYILVGIAGLIQAISYVKSMMR